MRQSTYRVQLVRQLSAFVPTLLLMSGAFDSMRPSGGSRREPRRDGTNPTTFAWTPHMNVRRPFRTIRVALSARSRVALRFEGKFLGLFSPDRSCTATFFLRPGYSIEEFLEEVEGPGFLTLKGDPTEPIALSIRGELITMIEFDRPVKWSSRFPRSIEITRGRPGEPSSSRSSPRSPRNPRTDFDGRCDPRDPSRQKGRSRKKGAASR